MAQEPILWAGSIRENILYGCNEDVTDLEMMEAAKLANIHTFIMETDMGYETKCGEKGVQLSGMFIKFSKFLCLELYKK